MRFPHRSPPSAAATAHRPSPRAALPALPVLLALVLAGCAAPPPAPIGVTEVSQRAGERALLEALRAWDDADYPTLEARARAALAAGLQSPRDRAVAHKLLAFVACTSERLDACEAEFRTARREDPGFALDKAEAGHPIWGPVYQRALR